MFLELQAWDQGLEHNGVSRQPAFEGSVCRVHFVYVHETGDRGSRWDTQGDKHKNEVPEATTVLFPQPQAICEADEGKVGEGKTGCYKKPKCTRIA